jgi:hypothetical protein
MRRIRDGPKIGNSYRVIFNTILKETDGTPTFREPGLDTEYHRILSITYSHDTYHSQDLSNALANFQAVVGVLVTLLHPPSLKVLAALIEMKEDKMRMILHPLSSVIQFSTDTELVYFYHASFREFLLGTPQCLPPEQLRNYPSGTEHSDDRQWVIDLPTAHCSLATACFRVMDDSLRFNICEIETSYLRNSDVNGISERIEKAIPPELVYATHCWADHLQSSPQDFKLLDHLEHHMHSNFLFWLEVLSLKGKTLHASSALIKARRWAQVRFYIS